MKLPDKFAVDGVGEVGISMISCYVGAFRGVGMRVVARR